MIMAFTLPGIGDWFVLPGGDLFEVVALDEEDATVEIQYFDGTVEELEFDSWAELSCKPAEPPEDYSGSMDIEREDYGLERETPRYAPSDPLNYLDQAE
jgi:hypothetical protein